MSILEHVYLILPFLAYAETHYSFKGIYSRLKKKEPEVVADAPHRVEPGKSIPLLILIKDAHYYPAKLNNVRVELIQNQKQYL